MLAGCGRGGEVATTRQGLSPNQLELVANIAEHIIPATDTPGAREVGVHRFIDVMMAEYYPAVERERFRDGLVELDVRAGSACGRAYLGCTKEQQRALVAATDAEAFEAPAPRPVPDPKSETERGAGGTPSELKGDTIPRAAAPQPARHWFRTMKELTLLGYYTSEAGATQELRHVPVPGRFDGCVPVTSETKTWAV